MTTKQRIRHVAEEIYGLIESWKDSEQGKAEFCKSSGIAICVFDYWRRKQKFLNKTKEARDSDKKGSQVCGKIHPRLARCGINAHCLWRIGIKGTFCAYL